MSPIPSSSSLTTEQRRALRHVEKMAERLDRARAERDEAIVKAVALGVSQRRVGMAARISHTEVARTLRGE